MSIKFEIDGWMRPYEYRALSSMFSLLAAGLEEDRKDRGFYDEPSDKPSAPEASSPPASTGAAVPSEEPVATNTPRAGESAEQTAQRTRTRKKKDEPAPQAVISTGEERISPEDDAATAEQDKADEQAEIEAKTEQPAAPVKDLTINDVKDAMQAYVDKFGLAETQQDGAHIYNDVLGAPPAGEAGWRLSLVPADKYAAAVAAWTKAAQSGSRYVAGTFKAGA